MKQPLKSELVRRIQRKDHDREMQSTLRRIGGAHGLDDDDDDDDEELMITLVYCVTKDERKEYRAAVHALKQTQWEDDY
ncbi:hypothetical protein DVA81_19740, partial [Acinetobacter baumannii]